MRSQRLHIYIVYSGAKPYGVYRLKLLDVAYPWRRA